MRIIRRIRSDADVSGQLDDENIVRLGSITELVQGRYNDGHLDAFASYWVTGGGFESSPY